MVNANMQCFSRDFLKLSFIFLQVGEGRRKKNLLILFVILTVNKMFQLSKVWQGVVLHTNKIFVAACWIKLAI